MEKTIKTKTMQNVLIVCPKCKEEIPYLSVSKREIYEGSLTLGNENKPFYDFTGDEFDCVEMVYFCPECDEELADTESKALKILKGIFKTDIESNKKINTKDKICSICRDEPAKRNYCLNCGDN